jgi:hypothetical protein
MLASMKLCGGANDQSSKESWLWWGFLAKREKREGGRGQRKVLDLVSETKKEAEMREPR